MNQKLQTTWNYLQYNYFLFPVKTQIVTQYSQIKNQPHLATVADYGSGHYSLALFKM